MNKKGSYLMWLRHKTRSSQTKLILSVTGIIVVVILGISQPLLTGAERSVYQSPSPTPENYQAIQALNDLVNDPDCTLPCWWGLTLGESTLEELQGKAVDNFGEPFSEREDGNFVRAGRSFPESIPNSPVDRNYLGVGFWFKASDSKLAAIGLDIDYPPGSYVNYSAYMLPGILSTYGKPDEATLIFLSGDKSSYNIGISYHNLGLYLSYHMRFDETQLSTNMENSLLICNNHLFRFRVWVQVSDIEYSERMKSGLWNNVAERLEIEHDVSGISTLSLENFSELFSQPGMCIQTLPMDQWARFVPDTLHDQIIECVADEGIQTSLLAKAEAGQWQAIINEVEALDSTQVTPECAAQIVEMARYFIENPPVGSE